MEQTAVQQYLLSFVKQEDELLVNMEQYASEHGVPIMDRLGMEFMLQMLRLIQPKAIFGNRRSHWLFRHSDGKCC
ncbi:hypothetical protein GCM10020331_036240 [Ectobacillus funiculus]